MDRVMRIGFCVALIGVLGMQSSARAEAVAKQEYLKLADEMHKHFDANILKAWFPAVVDEEHGGFRSNLTRDWKPAPKQDRFLVFQSRATWVASQVAMRRPELREEFLKYTRHGVTMLGKMWDAEQGGLYWGTDVDAKVTPAYGTRKCAYGISFAMYALASAYQASHDEAAIDLAMKTFNWFDDHAHDAAHGGYHEVLERDGTPIVPKDLSNTMDNKVGYPNRVLGFKSMNSHIHLLEAMTELYRAKKDDKVKARLDELFLIVRDRIAVDPGCLNLYFTPDWKTMPDHDSFGHDIETAFLLIEASEALGRSDEDRTWVVGRKLVDHALEYGFDKARGGFYDKGSAFDPATDTDKVWWTQAEGLNALLLMHEKFGGQTDRYWKAFGLTWKFVNNSMVDREFGGWYDTVAADGNVLRPGKAQNWKAMYHDGRALMEMEKRLRHMGGEK